MGVSFQYHEQVVHIRRWIFATVHLNGVVIVAVVARIESQHERRSPVQVVAESWINPIVVVFLISLASNATPSQARIL